MQPILNLNMLLNVTEIKHNNFVRFPVLANSAAQVTIGILIFVLIIKSFILYWNRLYIEYRVCLQYIVVICTCFYFL